LFLILSLSLLISPDVGVRVHEKWLCPCLLSIDPVEEACPTEAAWYRETDESCDCGNESFESQVLITPCSLAKIFSRHGIEFSTVATTMMSLVAKR
jgi:hypothetical protein